MLGCMFTFQNQGMSTQIVISFITHEKVIKIDINQAIASLCVRNKSNSSFRYSKDFILSLYKQSQQEEKGMLQRIQALLVNTF